MANTLNDIDSNELGDHLEDYCNDSINDNLREFLVLDSQSNIEDILEAADFEEVTNEDILVGIAVAEATLADVNRVLRAQGIDLEFQRFDAVDYHTYMLVNTNDSLKATAKRVRNFSKKSVDNMAV